MANIFAEFIIMALEERLYMLQENLMEMLDEHWMVQQSSFNHGQNAIYSDHMTTPISDWMEWSSDAWPYTDPGEYADMLYSCYDDEVMWRAFSGSIDSPLDRMYEIVDTAIQIQEAIYVLEASIF